VRRKCEDLLAAEDQRGTGLKLNGRFIAHLNTNGVILIIFLRFCIFTGALMMIQSS
jgi:hypothetical protein